jgi:hypothetical protein
MCTESQSLKKTFFSSDVGADVRKAVQTLNAKRGKLERNTIVDDNEIEASEDSTYIQEVGKEVNTEKSLESKWLNFIEVEEEMEEDEQQFVTDRSLLMGEENKNARKKRKLVVQEKGNSPLPSLEQYPAVNDRGTKSASPISTLKRRTSPTFISPSSKWAVYLD